MLYESVKVGMRGRVSFIALERLHSPYHVNFLDCELEAGLIEGRRLIVTKPFILMNQIMTCVWGNNAPAETGVIAWTLLTANASHSLNQKSKVFFHCFSCQKNQWILTKTSWSLHPGIACLLEDRQRKTLHRSQQAVIMLEHSQLNGCQQILHRPWRGVRVKQTGCDGLRGMNTSSLTYHSLNEMCDCAF